MKVWGYLIATAGALYILIAFNMDVSVSTTGTYVPGYGQIGGGEVANLDLMQRRQNHLIVACLVTLIGALLAIFGKSGTENDESQGAHTQSKEAPAEFDGEPDIADDRYRLWLAERYQISRNEVFDRFVCGDQTFRSLDAALEFAHIEESRKANEAREQAAKLQEEIERWEQERLEAAEQAEAEWQEWKPKVIAGGAIALAAIIGLYFAVRETPAEREARLAVESAEATAELEQAEAEIGVDLPDDVTKIAVGDGMSSVWCEDRLAMEGKTTEYRFNTDIGAGELRQLFVEKFGKGEPAMAYLEAENDGWEWESQGRSIFLQHIDYDGGNEKVVCITTENSE